MQQTTNTGSTALAVTATNLCEMGGLGAGTFLIGCVPSMTALAAAETVTLQLVRADTGAVIAASTFTNSGAGASGGGPLVVCGAVPAGMAGVVTMNILASVATGNAVGTATAPITLTALP